MRGRRFREEPGHAAQPVHSPPADVTPPDPRQQAGLCGRNQNNPAGSTIAREKFIGATPKSVQKLVAARKMSGELFASLATRSLANDKKVTVFPSGLTDGTRLLPFAGAGAAPAGMLASTVVGVQVAVVLVVKFAQVLRTKIFSTPFCVFGEKFDATDAKATN
jgi:hypothetical protein